MTQITLTPIHTEANTRLLSDEELEQYGTCFLSLNDRYQLDKHGFTFADFLENPNEIAIHRYFANRHLFESRKYGLAILLKTYLLDPDAILEAVLNVEAAIAEVATIGMDTFLPLLDKQRKVQQWLDITDFAIAAEQQTLQFERKHRVLLRGAALIEPFLHHYRLTRKKCAGG